MGQLTPHPLLGPSLGVGSFCVHGVMRIRTRIAYIIYIPTVYRLHETGVISKRLTAAAGRNRCVNSEQDWWRHKTGELWRMTSSEIISHCSAAAVVAADDDAAALAPVSFLFRFSHTFHWRNDAHHSGVCPMLPCLEIRAWIFFFGTTRFIRFFFNFTRYKRVVSKIRHLYTDGWRTTYVYIAHDG